MEIEGQGSQCCRSDFAESHFCPCIPKVILLALTLSQLPSLADFEFSPSALPSLSLQHILVWHGFSSHSSISWSLRCRLTVFWQLFLCFRTHMLKAHACAQSLSCIWLFAIPWTTAHQAPLSMGFSREESLSGLPFPPPWNLPNSGIEPVSPTYPALAGRFFTTEPPGKPWILEEFLLKLCFQCSSLLSQGGCMLGPLMKTFPK